MSDTGDTLDLLDALMTSADAGREGRGVLVITRGEYEIAVRLALEPIMGTAVIHTPRRTGQ